jgi:hypothetical protein
MESIEFSIRSNIKEIRKKLPAFAYQQIPFATATALTAIAKKVRDEEVKQMKATFKNPSPFTLKSVRIIPARKDRLYATVFVMDKAASYLEPYEVGGLHKLNSRALLNPKDISLNQYGQLRKGTLAALSARRDIFIGPVKTAKGVINGVWQRPVAAASMMTKSGKLKKMPKAANTSGALKLLIRFGDALPVKQHLAYRDRAKRIVGANINKELGKALAKAMATAKD